MIKCHFFLNKKSHQRAKNMKGTNQCLPLQVATRSSQTSFAWVSSFFAFRK
jgi:hypothetical protein